MNETDFPLPPATFEFLIASLKMQAEVQLGLLHFGDEKERPAPNLPIARHSIDMLAMLQEKTRGNLSIEEQRMVENSVTELRFRYIQVFEQSKQTPVGASKAEHQPALEETPEASAEGPGATTP